MSFNRQWVAFLNERLLSIPELKAELSAGKQPYRLVAERLGCSLSATHDWFNERRGRPGDRLLRPLCNLLELEPGSPEEQRFFMLYRQRDGRK